MNAVLMVGVVVLVGFIFGEIANRLKLPKVAGYILAGVLLDPAICPFTPKSILQRADLITNVALSFITFAIGGSLFLPKLKKLGKGIILMTLGEAEMAFIAIIVGFAFVLPIFYKHVGMNWFATFLPFSILLGSIGAPTDPSGILAVVHQYKAEGDVTSSILGVSAMDDVFGIINFSVAIVIARVLVLHQDFSVFNSCIQPLLVIFGSIVLGVFFGFIFNVSTWIIRRETEGAFFVLILGLLSLCFGLATFFKVDELLTTMSMGIFVVNTHPKRDLVFGMLERYTDELVFVLFFTISGMYLDFKILQSSFIYVIMFIILRTCGKTIGTWIGATVAGSSAKVRMYTPGGLVPLGGIVIGLALTVKQTPAFSSFAEIIINVIIASTVILEFAGPIIAKLMMVKAGEIVVKQRE